MVTGDHPNEVVNCKAVVNSLKKHINRKRSQSSSLHEISLKDDEILMQVDYSENYKNADQNKIQSALTLAILASVATTNKLNKYPLAITGELSYYSQESLFSFVRIN